MLETLKNAYKAASDKLRNSPLNNKWVIGGAITAALAAIPFVAGFTTVSALSVALATAAAAATVTLAYQVKQAFSPAEKGPRRSPRLAAKNRKETGFFASVKGFFSGLFAKEQEVQHALTATVCDAANAVYDVGASALASTSKFVGSMFGNHQAETKAKPQAKAKVHFEEKVKPVRHRDNGIDAANIIEGKRARV